MRNKIAIFFLKTLVSLAFIAWLIFEVDWNEAFLYFRKISIGGIAIYLSVLIIGILISSYKWMLLAHFKGFENPFMKYFQLYLAGTFINNFMPSFIGGDAYKAYQIGKKDRKYVQAASTVVVDRITGLLVAMALSVFFAALNWQIIAEHEILTVIAGIIFLCLASIPFLKIIASLPFWKKHIPQKMIEILADFAEFGNKKRIISKILLLSLIYNFVGLALVNYTLFLSLGIEVRALDYLAVIFMISIVSAIPISINNIGVKEWAYVTFFGFFGIASPAVVAVALISRIMQMVVSFAALPYYLRNKKQ